MQPNQPLNNNIYSVGASVPPVDPKETNVKNPEELPDHPSHIEEHLLHEDHIHKILLIGSIIVTVIAALCIACATYLGVLYQSEKSAHGSSTSSRKFHDECGISHAAANPRLLGGYDIVPSSWPSMGLLSYTYYTEYAMLDGQNVTINQTDSDLCGCILVDRLTVVTAANCIKKTAIFLIEEKKLTVPIVLNEYFPTTESMYTVKLSINKYLDEYDPIKRYYIQKIPVEKVIIHPDYDTKTGKNDIAILKLEREAGLGKRVQIACLPSASSSTYPALHSETVAVSWSFVPSPKRVQINLRDMKMTVVENKNCLLTDDDTKMCAHSLDGIDYNVTDRYDNGGALFAAEKVNSKTKYVLAGLIANSRTESNVYIRISSYRDWILRNSNINP